MGAIWLTLRAGFRSAWRGWLALALLLGVMSGVVLVAAAGARRTDTAYHRQLRWGQASHFQIAPSYTGGSGGYYRALRRLPQVAAMSTGSLLNMAIQDRIQEAAQTQVFASPDGRMGVSVDRVKVLTGRLFDPADPWAIVIDQKIADEEHVRPGGTVRLVGVPNDKHGNPDLRRVFPLTFRVSAIVVFNNQVAPVVTGARPTALLSPAFLRTAAGRRVSSSGDEAFVRLRPGASREGFLRAASALAARYRATGGKITAISTADQVAATQRAIRPHAVALALFAALAGVAALVIIGQLLGRQLVLDSGWFAVLRALGMSRWGLAALSIARVGAVTLAGGCLAVAIAIAASPLMPIGAARLAEPAPGIEVNLAILAVGFAVIALVPLAMVVPSARPTGCMATCYNFVLLRYRPGASPNAAGARLMAAVTRLGCPAGSCSVTADQRPLDIQGYAGIRDTPRILGALLALLGVAGLAHVLVTRVRRRRRDLAILKIIGMRRTQLLTVVSWQATALTAAALILGIPMGILAGRWSWVLFARSVGVDPSAHVPALLVLAEAAAALLVAITAAIAPGYAAARVRPAAVLRTE